MGHHEIDGAAERNAMFGNPEPKGPCAKCGKPAYTTLGTTVLCAAHLHVEREKINEQRMADGRDSLFVSKPDDDGEPRDLLAGLRTGDWLDRQQIPPLEYHIPNVVPEGLTLQIGAPKIGKSWLMYVYALSLAAGERVLGHVPVEQRPVLYLALEDGDRRMQDRARKLLTGDPVPRHFQYLTRVEPGRVLDTIDAWLDRHDGGFVGLDTLGRVMPPARRGETTYQRDYRVGVALKEIADAHAGSAALVNHHDRKAASEDFVDSVSGTNGLAGAADAIVVLTRRRQQADGLLQVTGRDVVEGEYAVTFEDCRWMLKGATFAEARRAVTEQRDKALGDLSSSILGFVCDEQREVTPGEVAARLDITNDTAGKYLRRLVKSGRLVKGGRGKFRSPVDVPPSERSDLSEDLDTRAVVGGVEEVSDTPTSSDGGRSTGRDDPESDTPAAPIRVRHPSGCLCADCIAAGEEVAR